MANSGTLTAPSGEWFKRFFKFGLISKGIVYCLLGGLAFAAAFGLAREKASKAGALSFIYEQPFGRIILAAIAVGLFGFVTLRFFQAFKDIDNKGDDTQGIFSRIGYGISGVLYGALAVYACKLVIQGGQESGDSRTLLVAKLLGYSWGDWVVGITGVIVIGSGIYQIYRGVSGKFMKKIRVMASDFHGAVKKAGMVGYTSRGVVLGIIGYLILHAAMTTNPKEAKGTEMAFAFIQNEFGSVLMSVIAAGLIAYGIFMFVKAKYQTISVH